jgi:septin family protein
MPTVIEENGVRLRLSIVDTPGYGDLVNNDRWYVRVGCDRSARY